MNGRQPFPDLTLRVVDESDLDAVIATYRGLSRQSMYRRFFTLTPIQHRWSARQFSMIDHRDHEALVVLEGDEIVGIAHWDSAGCCPDEAEIAITIADRWQRRGLGRVLIRALAGDAYRHGIDTLTATVLAENRAALGLAAKNSPSEVRLDGPEAHLVFRAAS